MFSVNTQKNKELCIYGVIRPLYIIARCFGFFPLSLNAETNDIRFRTTDLFIFATQVAVYCCATYLNLIHDLVDFLVMSPLLAKGIQFGIIFGLLDSIAFLLADLLHRQRVFQIFKLCQDFDSKMTFFGSVLNNRQIRGYVQIYNVVCVIIFVVYGGATLWILKDFVGFIQITVLFASFFLSTSVFAVVLSIYAFFIFNVKARFRLLNNTLRKLPVETADVRIVKPNIMKLADLHDRLIDILDLVNKCYSIQAMFAFAVSFTFVVFSLYGVYRGYITSTVNQEQFLICITLSMWASYYMFFVMTVSWAGHSSKKEGKFTGVIIHRAINKCHDKEVMDRLMAFSNQIHHSIPDANCKLFSFDWTLLFTMIAAVSTYLIILIQFDTSGPLLHEVTNCTVAN